MPFWWDLTTLKHLKYWLKRLVRVLEKLCAAHPDKGPPKPFKNSLSFQIFGELLGWVPAITIALDREPLTIPFHYEVDPVVAYLPLGADPIAQLHQALQYLPFEFGLDAALGLLKCAEFDGGILSMLD